MSSSMPWIKLYTDILDDPKVGRLTDGQKWRFVSLCLLAGECDQNGALVNGEEPMTEDDIAWRLRVPYDDLCSDLQALARIGVVTRDGQTWVVRKFAERQGRPQSEKRADWRDRQERYRDGEKDVTRESRVSHASRAEQSRADKEAEQSREEAEAEAEQNAPDVRAMLLPAANIAALAAANVGEPERSELSRLPFMAPDYIEAWRAEVGRRSDTENPTGLLVHCLRSGQWPDPPRKKRKGGNGNDAYICGTCHQRPCTCDDWKRFQ